MNVELNKFGHITCESWLQPRPGNRGVIGRQCGKIAYAQLETKLFGKVWLCRRHFLANQPRLTRPTTKPKE